MTEHTSKQVPAVEEVKVQINDTRKKFSFEPIAFLASSVLVGAVLISASLFYNTKIVLKRLDNASVNTVADNQVQQQPSAPSQQPPAQQGPVNITLKPDSPVLGKSDAKVTVVEYADYQCPFCEKWYTANMKELKAKYIDTGKVKFYYQDFAFLGEDSIIAGEATHCAADQGKFWQYHDYLFAHQGAEGGGWATAEHQKEFARALGLNTSQFNQCMDSRKYQQAVKDETEAGRGYGVSGTPSVFVNGKIIVGAQPFASLQQAIEAALK